MAHGGEPARAALFRLAARFGLHFARSVPCAALASAIPVIVQTGRRLDDSIRQRLLQAVHGQPGAARILRKSFDGRELFVALQRHCGFASELDGELLYQ